MNTSSKWSHMRRARKACDRINSSAETWNAERRTWAWFRRNLQTNSLTTCGMQDGSDLFVFGWWGILQLLSFKTLIKTAFHLLSYLQSFFSFFMSTSSREGLPEVVRVSIIFSSFFLGSSMTPLSLVAMVMTYSDFLSSPPLRVLLAMTQSDANSPHTNTIHHCQLILWCNSTIYLTNLSHYHKMDWQ